MMEQRRLAALVAEERVEAALVVRVILPQHLQAKVVMAELAEPEAEIRLAAAAAVLLVLEQTERHQAVGTEELVLHQLSQAILLILLVVAAVAQTKPCNQLGLVALEAVEERV
jgi:hypothetical protein